MKTQVMIFAILVILTAGVGFDIFTRHTAKPDDLWQYTVISLPDEQFSDQMNKLGASGWEIVSARRASNGAQYNPVFSYEMILKRHASPERIAELLHANQLPLPEKK